MRRDEQLFHTQIAGDVMSRATVVLPQGMSIKTAARLLLKQQVRVAPVTDTPGRCVGVLSAGDVLRWAADVDRGDERERALAASVWCDWQLVDEKPTRRDEVLQHMTRDPLLVTTDTSLAAIADALLESRCRPTVVVDEQRRPLGVVSSTDILAARAAADRQPVAEPAAAPTNGRVPLRRLAQKSGMA